MGQRPRPADPFFARLQALCGQRFAGRAATTDPADGAFAGKPLVMEARDCSPTGVRIPFGVGEGRSRTWGVTRTATGRRRKHDHRHADGSEDALSRYGGDTETPVTARRRDFPADAFSSTLFLAKGAPASIDNVWAIEVEPGVLFAHEPRRPNRHFRVEFDLSKPL